jgi:small redox-active disulfide protein 2
MDIKVLGTGCSRCRQLYAAAELAVAQSGLPVTLSKVEDIQEIMTYRVMMTPALVIDGEVKAAGRIPKPAEIVTWIVNKAGHA